jgi:hypothetical protein
METDSGSENRHMGRFFIWSGHVSAHRPIERCAGHAPGRPLRRRGWFVDGIVDGKNADTGIACRRAWCQYWQ